MAAFCRSDRRQAGSYGALAGMTVAGAASVGGFMSTRPLSCEHPGSAANRLWAIGELLTEYRRQAGPYGALAGMTVAGAASVGGFMSTRPPSCEHPDSAGNRWWAIGELLTEYRRQAGPYGALAGMTRVGGLSVGARLRAIRPSDAVLPPDRIAQSVSSSRISTKLGPCSSSSRSQTKYMSTLPPADMIAR